MDKNLSFIVSETLTCVHMPMYAYACIKHAYVELEHVTTRKTSYCGRSIAAGAKTAAICHLLRRIFGSPLYNRSIEAFSVTVAIGKVFCGVLQRWDIKLPQ